LEQNIDDSWESVQFSAYSADYSLEELLSSLM